MKKPNKKNQSPESLHPADLVTVSFTMPRAEHDAMASVIEAFMEGSFYENRPADIAARAKILLRRDYARLAAGQPAAAKQARNIPASGRLWEN